MAQAIPEGFHSVTPHIVVKDAAAAIKFYQQAFGAEEICRLPGPDGSLMYAEVNIGDSRVMLAEERPEWGGPKAIGGTPVTLHIYAENADALFARATAAGAKATMPMMDMFWGDRYGMVEDPFGHRWSIAKHIEDLTPEQIGARSAEWFAKHCSEK